MNFYFITRGDHYGFLEFLSQYDCDGDQVSFSETQVKFFTNEQHADIVAEELNDIGFCCSVWINDQFNKVFNLINQDSNVG